MPRKYRLAAAEGAAHGLILAGAAAWLSAPGWGAALAWLALGALAGALVFLPGAALD